MTVPEMVRHLGIRIRFTAHSKTVMITTGVSTKKMDIQNKI